MVLSGWGVTKQDVVRPERSEEVLNETRRGSLGKEVLNEPEGF